MKKGLHLNISLFLRENPNSLFLIALSFFVIISISNCNSTEKNNEIDESSDLSPSISVCIESLINDIDLNDSATLLIIPLVSCDNCVNLLLSFVQINYRNLKRNNFYIVFVQTPDKKITIDKLKNITIDPSFVYVDWDNDFSKCRSEEHTSELQSRENLVCR